MPNGQYSTRQYSSPVASPSSGGGGGSPTAITANSVFAVGPSSGTTITQAVDGTGATYLRVTAKIDITGTASGVSATYNGVSMTQLALVNPFLDTFYYVSFGLVSPASGSHNVVITLAGATILDSQIECIPFSGVNTSTPTGTTVSASGTSGTASVTVSSAVGELVVASLVAGSTVSVTPGVGQTVIGTNTTTDIITATTQIGAASVNSTWTFGINFWATISTPLKP